jgi:phospholipid/cholesterol/gamma-HCH transport system substrate-binding protein
MSRLPERDTRKGATNSRFNWRPNNAVIAVIFILIFTIGPYLAFTGHVPFTSYGYEVKATFSNSANIALNSPVRIAGVDVGRVISSERDGDSTTVSFTVEGKGRPIHEDAFAEVKPRIFLEGNFFIELDPGSPSAPEMGSGETIPVSHTSTAVQLDEILTALQSPVRADLSRLLESYGKALTSEPTAAEDEGQLPEVQGRTGAEALNDAFKYGGDAGRYSAQVTNAFLGTSPRDLSRLISGSSRTFAAFASREKDLQGLITNFNVFTGALAAQSANLSTTINLLAPTLQVTHKSLVSLNNTLPPLRTYAIEFRPAVAELPDLISASKPWLAQVRPLLSGKEGAAGRIDSGPRRRRSGRQAGGDPAAQPAQPLHDPGDGPDR